MKTVEQMARECHMSHLVDGGEFDCSRGLAKFAALVMEECAEMCDARYEKRAAEGLPREAANSRSLADAIRSAAKDLK